MTARILFFLVLFFAAGCWLAWRLIGTGKGQHRAPRGFSEADERLADTSERVIPRAVTGHAPPWDPAPAAVIEATAVTQGPPPGPGPVTDAYIVATGTLTGGRLHSARIAVLPPLPGPSWPGELHPKVAAQLGHATTDAAVDSMFNRAMARQVRQLTDGTSCGAE